MAVLASAPSVVLRGEAFELRPSLRLGFRIFRQHQLQTLVQKITEGHLGIAAELIGDHCELPFLERHILEAGLDRLAEPLVRYVLLLASIDPDAPASTGERKGKGKGKPENIEESLTSLYRLGSGWLGWPPEVTLEASPAEILEAQKGRVEMLQALFGGGEKRKATADLPLEDKFRFAMAELGARRVEAERTPDHAAQ